MLDTPAIQDQVIDLMQMRHLWPRIARDLVCMSLSQVSSATAMTYEDVASAYNMTVQELYVLSELEAFKDLVKKEHIRAKQLGVKAGFLLRAETIAIELAERAYTLCSKDNADLKDVIKAADLFIKAAGLGVERDAPVVTSTVAVQFNLPALNNPKLDHLKPLRVEADA